MEMSIQRLQPMTGVEPMEMDMLKTGQLLYKYLYYNLFRSRINFSRNILDHHSY